MLEKKGKKFKNIVFFYILLKIVSLIKWKCIIILCLMV